MEFVEQVAASDVTEGDINRLQVCALYSRILTKAERQELSQTLGVLKAILAKARQSSTPDALKGDAK